jgi:hypothetical protein
VSLSATLPVTPEVHLRIALPAGAADEAEGALPKVDLASVPGATITLRRGFTGADGIRTRVLCVLAPSDRWAPGVEELVLGRASALAAGVLGGQIERFEGGAIVPLGPRFEQRFEGVAMLPDAGHLGAVGRHMLGFVGAARDVVLCSLLCVEPSPPGAQAVRCGPLVDASTIEGAFTEMPPPSPIVRAILLAAERPREALVAGGLLALASVAWILARRPRPRW